MRVVADVISQMNISKDAMTQAGPVLKQGFQLFPSTSLDQKILKNKQLITLKQFVLWSCFIHVLCFCRNVERMKFFLRRYSTPAERVAPTTDKLTT